MADVVFSLEQTDRLPKPCDPLQSKFQPIHPFTTTTQAASTASDKHTQSVLRDGAADGQPVIKQKCNSLACVEHSSQTPSFHKKTNHWTGMAKVSQHLTKAFGKNSDGLQSYSLPGSVPWDPVFSNPPWYLPESHHTTQTRAVKMLPAPTGLPVLSRWECEVNAPLGAPSQLLQGNELTTVLDQVTPAVPWY